VSYSSVRFLPPDHLCVQEIDGIAEIDEFPRFFLDSSIFPPMFPVHLPDFPHFLCPNQIKAPSPPLAPPRLFPPPSKQPRTSRKLIFLGNLLCCFYLNGTFTPSLFYLEDFCLASFPWYYVDFRPLTFCPRGPCLFPTQLQGSLL